jgi:hypothetical protein
MVSRRMLRIGHAPLLGDVTRDLHQFATALLVELGHGQADQPPVVVGRQAHVGLHDRPLDRLDRRLVVGLHGEQPRLRARDRGELAQRASGRP